MIDRLYSLIKEQEEEINELKRWKTETEKENTETLKTQYNWRKVYCNEKTHKPSLYTAKVIIDRYSDWKKVQRNVIYVFDDDVEFNIQKMDRCQGIDSATVEFTGEKSMVRRVKEAIMEIINC